MSRKFLASFLCLTAAVVGRGADAWKLPVDTAKLKPGPGMQLVVANCVLCHSVDYISTQPRLTRAQWQAAIVKMQQKYGASLATNNVNAIADYLFQNYGLPAN